MRVCRTNAKKTEPAMLTDQFISANRESWERLAALLDRVDRSGLSSLAPAELEELARLYRRVAGHLSEARSAGLESQTVAYLNRLVTRAYARVYAGSRPRRMNPWRLFAVETPRTFRRRAPYIGVALAVTLMAATLSFSAVRSDERWAHPLSPGNAAHAWREFGADSERAGEYFADTARALGGPEFSAILMSNNIRVALNAFALGVTLGLGTLYVLIINGMMLGAFFGVGANADRLVMFAAVVAPHGVLELSAIFIAGGAGLIIGHALVDPGDLYRRDALRIAAADAVKLVLGTVPMFIVAGVIEGMVSPQYAGLFADNAPRILFGLMAGAAFWLCLFFGDRLWGGD